MNASRFLVLSAGCLLWPSALLASDKTDPDKQAAEVFAQLCRSVDARDLDGLMKMIDVPWIGAGLFFDIETKDKAEVRKAWENLFKAMLPKDQGGKFPVPKMTVCTYAKYVEMNAGNKDRIARFNRLGLTNQDRVVNFEKSALFVRIRGTDAKIVGFCFEFEFKGKLF